MMVTFRDWILQWLLVVNLSKAAESLVDGTSMVKHRELGPNGVDHWDAVPQEFVRTSGELTGGDLSALVRQHAYPKLPKKMLGIDTEEAIDDRNHDDNVASVTGLSLEERKAQIQLNMASNQEQFDAMKTRGEPMVNWINILLQREKMLEMYTESIIGGENTSSLLRKLRGIQMDIKRAVRSRFREWVGLGGRVFEPRDEENVAKTPQKMVYGPTGDLGNKLEATHVLGSNREVEKNLESNAKVIKNLERYLRVLDHHDSNLKVQFQPKTDSLIVPDITNSQPAVQEKLAEAQKLTEEAALTSFAESAEKKLGGPKKPKPQLNESHLTIIYDKVMESSFKELSYILHSVTFRSWEVPAWKNYWEEIRVTKLTFQRSILQAIQFMSKFELVEKSRLGKLLSSDQTLDLIGNHLVDLFHVVRGGGYNILAFIPDMDFLMTHWRTDYLHDLFKVIGKSQQAHILSAALTCMTKLYLHFVMGSTETEWSAFLDKLIFQKHFLLRLENRAPEPSHSDWGPNEEINLKELGGKLVNFFQEPLPIHGQDFKSGYFILYHILKYIETYHNEFMESLFSGREVEYNIFIKQLEFLKTGLKVCQSIKQGQTYREIILSQKDNIYTISKHDASRKLVEIKNIYEDMSSDYIHLDNYLKQVSESNSKLKHWFEGYGTISSHVRLYFYSKANGWDLAIELEQIRKESRRFIVQMEDYYECFPNLKKESDAGSSSKDKSNLWLPNKELLGLWDPESFYI